MQKSVKSNIKPFKMYGNLYFVGSTKVSVHIIKTDCGLVMIDTGYPDMYEQILDSMHELNLDPKDICAIFHSHGHIDHYGCTREFKELSGAKTYISRIDNETELADALVKAGKRAKQSEFKSRHKGRMYPLLRIFKFSDFEDLCCGIKEIHELYIGKSRLLKYMGNFYLELLPQDNFGNFEMDNILSEFGEKAKRPLMLQGVLNEHGKLMIAADAVNIIATNFV